MKISEIVDNKEYYKGEVAESSLTESTYGLTEYLLFSGKNNQFYTYVTKTFGGEGSVDRLVLDTKRKHQELIKAGVRQVPEDEHLVPSERIYPCELSKEEIMDKFRVYPSRVGLLA